MEGAAALSPGGNGDPGRPSEIMGPERKQRALFGPAPQPALEGKAAVPVPSERQTG